MSDQQYDFAITMLENEIIRLRTLIASHREKVKDLEESLRESQDIMEDATMKIERMSNAITELTEAR